MSALILLASAVMSYVAFASQHDARNTLLRDVADGMAKASAIFLFTILAACVVVFVFSVSMDTDVAAMKLRDIESGLRFAQGWRAQIFGPWDWRLVLAYVGIGVAGALFALGNWASRIMWGLRHTKVAGAVLALLASLTITTLPAEEALRDLELRYAEATDAMASDAKAIENRVAVQVRESAINAVEEAVLYCNETSRPACRQLEGLHQVPPHFWLARDPRLSAIWEGTYVWTDTTHDDATVTEAKRQSVARPFAERRALLAEAAPGELKSRLWNLGAPNDVQFSADDSASRALLGLAADAGYEMAIEAARHAGASGDIVEALLTPLVAAPLKALLERLTRDAISRALSGTATLADINDQVRSSVDNALKTGESAAAIDRAIAASADALGAAEASSGQTLVDIRQREDDREAAARASDGAPVTIGSGLVGIPFDGGTVSTGSTVTYGGQPGAGKAGGRPLVVH